MTIDSALFAKILPIAIDWARAGEASILQSGRSLEADEIEHARLAGVKRPELIKVCLVPRIPYPDDGLLGLANEQLQFIGSATAGLTLNYGIYVREDCAGDRALLFHECVHVSQYERLGGFEGFLPRYLQECIQVGYHKSPLECEAVEMTQKMRDRLF